MQLKFASLGLVAIAFIAFSCVSAMSIANRNDVYSVDHAISSSKKVTGTVFRRDPGLFKRRRNDEADEDERDEEEGDERRENGERREGSERESDDEESDEYDYYERRNSDENENELKRRGVNVENTNSPIISQQQTINDRHDQNSYRISTPSNGNNVNNFAINNK